MKRLIALAVIIAAFPAIAQQGVKIQVPTGQGNSYQTISPSFPLPIGSGVLTTTQTSVTVSISNTFQQALASSTTRKGCTIQYVGVAGTKGYVFFGSSPLTTTSFQLTNGQTVNCSGGFGVLGDAVQVTGTATDVFIVSSQ